MPLVSLLCLALMPLFLTACPKTEVLSVGAVLPITGAASSIGVQQQNGIGLAAQTFNGAKSLVAVNVWYRDSASDPAMGVSAFEDLVEDGVSACVSSLSGVSQACAPVAEKYEVPMLAVGASLPNLTDNRLWTFRNHPTSVDESEAMAGFLASSLMNLKSIAVFYLDDVFGRGARDAFRGAFETSGGEVVWEGLYSERADYFSGLISSATKAKPDGVYVTGYVEATLKLIEQIRDAGMDQPLAANMAMATPHFIEQAGTAYDGVFFTVTPFTFEKNTPGTAAFDFAERYRATYNAEPDAYAAMAYDALGMILDADSFFSVTRERVRDHLASLSTYDGVLGSLSMNADHSVGIVLNIAQFVEGELEFIE